jgi:hypothetical protein
MESAKENYISCDIFINKTKGNIEKNTTKIVRFNGTVSVFLIPNINDIYNIKHLLWYDHIDYQNFLKP